ncbi:hypothetical protein HCU66_20550 [Pseudomonas frederiksbergensis]|uniref:hypothetical protein n=1 Tax=Pseudomonas frederiksbergensis TaxID=104087 RepID=UPI00197F4EE3|nr:hypothetical protein [Pseudomonas frederiksbergensis]MBN3864625.1 hypothetical protein [Pseudomonas frederiksbergensis]
MSKSTKSKLKKKSRLDDIRHFLTETKGSRSPRLEIKLHKISLLKSGSAYTAIIAKRDDMEVLGAMASLENKSIDDLKKKYKKYKTVSL